MKRRDVIKSMGLISVHALYPAILTSFLTSCSSDKKPGVAGLFFDAEEQLLIQETVDIILPKTGTMSASEAGVPVFLDEVFAQCLNVDQKELIKEGLAQLKSTWKEKADNTALIESLDKQAFAGDEDAAWFKTVKQYTLIGFFTSKEGATKASDYQKIPEKYIGDVTIDENTLVHAKTSLRFN